MILFARAARAAWQRDRLNIVGFVFALLIVAIMLPSCAGAQVLSGESMEGRPLPDAPSASVAAVEEDGQKQVSNLQPASIYGTVLSTNSDVIQGAQVTLTGQNEADLRVTQSGSNGEFSFTGLPPGTYKITVTGQGMAKYVSNSLTVHSGDALIAPPSVLSIAAEATEIRVTADKDELAEEQVKIAEEQRIFGVVPNFYSSYDWNAPPLGTKQKYKLATRALIDPVSFLGIAGVAGYEQWNNTFPGYGKGLQGYAKRYGAAYANDFTARMLGSAVFASIFHEDPRYFVIGAGGGGKRRTFYAISGAVMTRTDAGKWRPNYSLILGTFASGALSNLYYPAADRGVGLTITNSVLDIAGRAGTNVIREFLLKGVTSHAGGRP